MTNDMHKSTHPSVKTLLGTDKVRIIAQTDDTASAMSKAATADGLNVIGQSVWDGPVPPDSYMYVLPWLRMATPGFMLLRRTRELGVIGGALLASELTGFYATNMVRQSLETGEWTMKYLADDLPDNLDAYLAQVADTPDGEHAIAALRLSTPGLESPMQAWLAIVARVALGPDVPVCIEPDTDPDTVVVRDAAIGGRTPLLRLVRELGAPHRVLNDGDCVLLELGCDASKNPDTLEAAVRDLLGDDFDLDEGQVATLHALAGIATSDMHEVEAD